MGGFPRDRGGEWGELAVHRLWWVTGDVQSSPIFFLRGGEVSSRGERALTWFWEPFCAEEQLAWENLDGDVVDHAPQPIYPAALFVTLLTAGRSFEAPTSTISRSLQATHFEETAAALHAIHAWCVEQDKLISISPQDLRAGLELVVLQYLRQTCVPLTSQDVPTPPGWTRFLQLWLNRAVNFTTRRRCERVDLEHEGVHYHADDGLIWWSDPAPARRLPCMGDLKIDKSFEEADAMLE
jgi:hypothetical protein